MPVEEMRQGWAKRASGDERDRNVCLPVFIFINYHCPFFPLPPPTDPPTQIPDPRPDPNTCFQNGAQTSFQMGAVGRGRPSGAVQQQVTPGLIHDFYYLIIRYYWCQSLFARWCLFIWCIITCCFEEAFHIISVAKLLPSFRYFCHYFLQMMIIFDD